MMIIVDFYESKLGNVKFDQCDLNEANLTGTSLKAIDLRSCYFLHLLLDKEILNGRTVNTEQATGFAGLLELKIKDK